MVGRLFGLSAVQASPLLQAHVAQKQAAQQRTCEGVVPPPDIMASCSASSYTMRCPPNLMSHSLRPPLGRIPTCTGSQKCSGRFSRWPVLCILLSQGKAP